MTNKMQLFGLFICTQSALHVSGDVFVHHQEHFTLFTASDIVHLCCFSLLGIYNFDVCVSVHRYIPPILLPADVMDEMKVLRISISSMTPAGSNIGELYQKV